MQLKLFRATLLLVFSTTFLFTSAQQDIPTDYLTPSFHKGRRDAARALMPENSVMVVFAAPERTFSNDVTYLYHQNPDLYYFTGYKEPHAVLFIFKEAQKAADGSDYNEIFFVQKKDARSEQWTGRRLGVDGVKQKLGIQTVFIGDELKSSPLDLSTFAKVLTDNFPDDIKKRTRRW